MYCIKTTDGKFLNNKLQKVAHITVQNGLIFDNKEEANNYINLNLNSIDFIVDNFSY